MPPILGKIGVAMGATTGSILWVVVGAFLSAAAKPGGAAAFWVLDGGAADGLLDGRVVGLLFGDIVVRFGAISLSAFGVFDGEILSLLILLSRLSIIKLLLSFEFVATDG